MLQETKTSICNKALSLCGEDPINSIEDDTSLQARSCRAHYDLVLHKVLEEGHWSFATVEENLQRIVYRAYSEEQKFVYAVPNNCALITKIYKKSDRKSMLSENDWDLRYIEDLGVTAIVCDHDNQDKSLEEDMSLVCEYVRVRNNFFGFPAKFLECLVAALAASICMDITKDIQKTQYLMQLYKMLKDEALRNNFNEDGEDKMHWVDPITNSRG